MSDQEHPALLRIVPELGDIDPVVELIERLRAAGVDPFAYLSEKEYAAERGDPKATLAKERHLGNGPPYIKARKTIRYRRLDIELYAIDNTVTPGPKPARAAVG
jgi:hypothetical protein